MRLILTVFVTFTLATTIGCSIIDSSGSISDSISSPSKSISNSSSGDDGSESPLLPHQQCTRVYFEWYFTLWLASAKMRPTTNDDEY